MIDLKIGDYIRGRVFDWGRSNRIVDGTIKSFGQFGLVKSEIRPVPVWTVAWTDSGLAILLESAEIVVRPGLVPNNKSSTNDQLGKAQGKGEFIEEKFIKRGDKLYGPYYYLRYREGGKLRSKYLGRDKPD